VAEGRSRFTAEELDDLRERRVTQADLARARGVSRMTIVRWLRDEPNAPTSKRTAVKPFWPWEVIAIHQNSAPYNRSHDHLRRVLLNDPLDEERRKKLRVWYTDLQENREVLTYDPDAPPTPWRVKHGGFTYEPREPEDEDLIIRVPDPQWWTPERRAAWRLPEG
jgi:hypothetical protein